MAIAIPKDIKASLYIDGKPAETSLKAVEQHARTLNADLKKLSYGTDEWNAKMKEVAKTKKFLQDVKDEINGIGGAFGRLKKEIGELGKLAFGYLGFQFITQQFQDLIAKNAQLSDSLADVRKTTGLTEEEVLSLNKALKQINTRTSSQELLNLATVAGKLGVTGKEDVLGFVRAADKISVALGRDLGDTEQAVNDLGKLADLFKIKDQFGLEQALIKTGSAINSLGAAGTASEGYIVEFTKRMGTIAPAANISIENIMGLAATMDELGQPAEAASTALAQFVVGMGKDLPTFAKVAGMSVKNFSAILRKDGNEALITVLSKLKATGGGVQELAAKMGLVGEDGARATAALGALSNNLDKLRDRQRQSNDEFAKGTSLTNEFNIKNDNLAATLDKIGKWFYNIATSKVITDTLTSAAQGFARLLGITTSHSQELEKEQTKLFALRIELESSNTTNQRRVEIMGELQTMYPDLLANIDKENTKNSDLLPILERINQQYIIRVAYQKRMEDLDAAVKDEAESMNDVYDNRQKLIMGIAKIQNEIQKDGIKFTIQGKNENEKAIFIYKNLNKAIAEQAVKNKDLQAIQGNNKYDILIGHLNLYGNALKSANDDLNDHRATRKQLEQEATNFKNSFTFKENEIKGSEKMQIQATLLFANMQKMNKETKEYKDTLKQVQGLNTVIAMQKKAEAIADSLKPKGNDPAIVKELQDLNYRIALKKKELGLLNGNSKTGADPNAKFIAPVDKKAEKEAESARKKALAEFERLDEDYKKLNLQRLNDQLSSNEKEVKQEEDKYDALIQKERDFLNLKGATPKQKEETNSRIEQLSADKTAAVSALRVRQEKEMVKQIGDLRTKLTNLHENELQKQSDQINKFYDELEAKNEGNEKQLAFLKLERAKELGEAEKREKERLEKEKADIEEKYDTLAGEKPEKRLAKINKKYDDEIDALKKSFGVKIKLTEDFNNAVALIEKNRAAELKLDETDKRKERSRQQLEAANSVSQSLFSIWSNSREHETNKFISVLEDRRRAELENSNLTEDQKKEINARYDEKIKQEKLRAWKAQQAADVAQAVVNGALAMTKVSAQTGVLSFAFSPFVAAATAAQVAVILAQKPPEYAEGGMTDQEPSGYVSNATLFRNSASGRSFIAGEKGREWIAPNWMLQNPATANIIGTLEVARKEKRLFSNGGFNGTQSSTPTPVFDYDFIRLEAKLDDLITAQNRRDKIPVVLDYYSKERYEKEIKYQRSQQGA